ncbi:MAG: PEP-CTERM sorting domain-containing protein [Bryobacteraceae bacterium]
MRPKLLLAVLVLVCAAAFPLTAASVCDSQPGNLVTNCGFETGDFTGWTPGGNWEFASVVGGAFGPYPGANSGSYYAVLGPVGSDGTLSQTLTTIPGTEYNVSFYLDAVGDNNSDFNAYWNGVPFAGWVDPTTIPPAGGPPVWTQYLFTVTGTGSDTITFGFRDDPAYLALDDVYVGAVPEPGTLSLLIAGIGLVLLGRRRHA